MVRYSPVKGSYINYFPGFMAVIISTETGDITIR